MNRFSETSTEICRVILLRFPIRKSPEVLLNLQGIQYALPEMRVAHSERIAGQLTVGFKEIHALEVIDLYSLQSTRWQSDNCEGFYEVMEPYDAEGVAPPGHLWVAIHTLPANTFYDSRDFDALKQAAVSGSLCNQESCGPFSRPGWFHTLKQWVQEEVSRRGIHLKHPYRQLSACPTFSLVRFETDGPAIWFKAVGAPNEHEYSLTLALAQSHSRFVPEIIATRPDCNGWLAREAEGPLLRECRDPSCWEANASELAELQACSVGGTLTFLDSGAHDLRILALENAVDPFLDLMIELMERQTKISPTRISAEGLRTLCLQLQDALDQLEQTSFPDTLGHLDLNPGNIVCSPRGSVFLDWAEGFVGHPFITFEYLLEHFRRAFGKDSSSESGLVASYLSRWRELAAQSDILSARRLMPLLAPFACAVRICRETNPEKFRDPRTAGYLRGLTRRMEREASGLRERSFYGVFDRAASL